MNLSYALFLFISFTLLLSISNSDDSNALLSFKASLRNPYSLSSWSNSSKPCSSNTSVSWIGVSCRKSRVTQLVLENMNLTGSIEALTELTQLRILSLKHNSLHNSLHSSGSGLALSLNLNLSKWRNMKLLYLNDNNFTREFPYGVDQLLRIRRVDFSKNKFEGRIPFLVLSKLPHLITLRLEENAFTGTLVSVTVSSKTSFVSLVDLNVSYNMLYGEIPEVLSTFPTSGFIGNKDLCGRMLNKNCNVDSVHPNEPLPVNLPSKKQKKLKYTTILIIVFIDVLALIVLIIGIWLYQRSRRKGDTEKMAKSKKKNEKMLSFKGYKGYKLPELLKSSAEMLGRGGLGTTYKVMMDNGDVIVVKRIAKKMKRRKSELLREIGALRHRNVVSLLAACYCSKDKLLLVYDYLPNGSLASLIQGNRWPGTAIFDWRTRLKIASDISEGLMHLHCVCKSKFIHGNLTSLNVIIDQEGNACIIDIAMHKLFLTEKSSSKSNIVYKAPEAVVSSKMSSKSDVYSFGVILLEVLTGKMAIEGGESNMSLVEWVDSAVKEKRTADIFDFELLSYKGNQEQMMSLLEVAFLCLAKYPIDRPKMSTIHKMIEDIRAKGWSHQG